MPPLRTASAAAAIVVGGVAIAATRTLDVIGPLATMPLLQLLGLGAAVGLAPFLGPKVASGSMPMAFILTLAYGALVPGAVAALFGVALLPLFPVVVAVSVAAWPVTMPAALAWALLLRWRRSRERLGSPGTAVVVSLLAALLVVVRFTQPLVTRSSTGEVCASYPGESIERIEWSPSGRWLAFASHRSHATETIRILDAESGRIHHVISGQGVMASFGMAVDDDGLVWYQAPISGSDAPLYREDLALWVTSAGGVPASLGRSPGLTTLVNTSGGIAGIRETSTAGGVEQRAFWLRTEGPEVDLVPLTDEELARHPEAAIQRHFGDPFRVRLGSKTFDVAWPEDVGYDLSITPDHRHLVFFARGLTYEGILLYERLVAQSVETGERTVIREGDTAWSARIAGGRVASITYPDDENRLCVSELDPSLGLTTSPGR